MTARQLRPVGNKMCNLILLFIIAEGLPHLWRVILKLVNMIIFLHGSGFFITNLRNSLNFAIKSKKSYEIVNNNNTENCVYWISLNSFNSLPFKQKNS